MFWDELVNSAYSAGSDASIFKPCQVCLCAAYGFLFMFRTCFAPTNIELLNVRPTCHLWVGSKVVRYGQIRVINLSLIFP